MAGCVAHGEPGGRAWREVRTRRFLLVTDLGKGDARARASQLEELGGVLADLYRLVAPRSGPSRTRPVRLLHLASCAELRHLRGRNVAGFVIRSFNFGGERLIVTCESGEHRSETAIHELVHDLNARSFRLPAWLEEGLATYYQTLVLTGGNALVGRPPTAFDENWGDESGLPGLAALVAMPHDQLVAVPRQRGYFAAWYLTHLLANGGPDHPRRFRRLLAGLGAGEDREAAFAAAFGDVKARVAADYRNHRFRRGLVFRQVRHIPYRKQEGGRVVGERRLRPGEVHALWIELSALRFDRAALVRRLALLEREDPDWPARLYWRAVVLLQLGRAGNAPIHLLRRYVRRAPGDGQGWLGLVRLEIHRRLPPGHLGVEAAAPERLAELEGDARALARVARTPRQLDTVGWYYALRRMPDEGLRFTRRALAMEPSCADCWDTLALLHYHAGRAREAAAAQERALALMAGRMQNRGAEARLRHYLVSGRSGAGGGPGVRR